MGHQYDVAAYIWPAFTGDEPRARMFWPEGIGEWESVQKATAKFHGHSWPRRPVWGYVNEADPYVMEMEINAAADHGVNVFIYDWYWYDQRPFLENCLNNGYLKARNNDRVKFYLMWANHDVNELWDVRLSDELIENVIWQAGVNRSQFERIADRLIENYFKHPSYYTIDDKPVFMIFDLQTLINGLGGEKATRDALDWFRNRAIDAGLAGLHLQLCLRNSEHNLSGVDKPVTSSQAEMVKFLNFDSVTHYQYIQITDINRDYAAILEDVVKEWERIEEQFTVPYFPHVTIGWDNNPRFKELQPNIVRNNTPENIEKALLKAKEYVDNHTDQTPLITINSWNEWTETSYLQPDNVYGYGYLEAVRSVFGPS